LTKLRRDALRRLDAALRQRAGTPERVGGRAWQIQNEARG